MERTIYDAIVVGSGPNGLAAAIALQQKGLSVLLVEGKDTIGGGLRSQALTLPGYIHDVCSAVHPLAAASPFLATLPLHEHGLEYIQPTIAAAHPFDDGTAAALYPSLTDTAGSLGVDGQTYTKLIQPVVNDWPLIADDMLGPLGIPEYPLKFARFGIKAMQPATMVAHRFASEAAKGLWAGMAAHALQPLSNVASAAIGLVLMANAHRKGWVIPRGGSQAIANAMASYFKSLGGIIQTGVLC